MTVDKERIIELRKRKVAEYIRETRTVFREKTAVFLIDMQTANFPNIRDRQKASLLASQRMILILCAKYDVPVCVFEYARQGPTLPMLRNLLLCVPRTISITKYSNNGFVASLETTRGKQWMNIECLLHEWKISDILLMGIRADRCIRSTAIAGNRLGFRIVTSPSLIAGEPDDSENDSLSLYEKIGTIIPDISILEE